jgi:hypothetical protein
MGINVEGYFGGGKSEYLSAADIIGKSASRVTISNVKESPWDDAGGNKKLGVFFEGKELGVCLNKTNLRVLADAFGMDTQAWTGCVVEVYAEKVDYQGSLVPGMKIRIPVPTAEAGDEAPF